MDVSVIIPVRDGAKHIQEQLACLAQQHTTLDWELVVADNGSSDATVAVVLGCAETFPAPVRVIDASARAGAAHARNVGASAASGHVFAFCDSDDWVAQGWVEAAFSAAHEGDVAVGLLISETGVLLNEVAHDSGSARPHILSGNFAITRKLFELLGGFDAELPPYGAEDMEFNLRARDHGCSIKGVPGMIVKFRNSSSPVALLRKVFLNGRGEMLIWYKRGEAPSVRRTLVSLASWPASALRWWLRPSKRERESGRVLLRQLVRRASHVYARTLLLLTRDMAGQRRPQDGHRRMV